ncbi:serine/threonine-protein kinase pim-3-like [Antennarius striatus]|uniref:serine/threonine-protein kinase pim-3-like n=1 Tax=Antennarius striatus TaxID=241820 RepID=UPI0035AFB912
MQQLAGGPESVGQSPAVTLIDWYRLGDIVILIIERPEPCKTLMAYTMNSLSEHQAKNIMRQLVAAAIDMISKGVSHNDIKTDNILVELNSNGPRVRVIDFGYSSFMWETHLIDNVMTDDQQMMKDKAEQNKVLQLGEVLYDILTEEPVIYISLIPIRSELKNVSQECQDFLKKCLNSNSESRVTLEDLQQHPWMCQN